MPALAELPDGYDGSLPSGNSVVHLQMLAGFMNDLHETIVSQILGGRTYHCEDIDGETVTYRLPMKQQLHDFVAFSREDNHEVSVVLKMPSEHPRPNGEYIYHTEIFEYRPPKPETPKLPSFSLN